jgi:CRP/FNR family cyclic AMP-dependent transcriptional regulator
MQLPSAPNTSAKILGTHFSGCGETGIANSLVMGVGLAGIGEATAGILLAEGDDIVARRASLIELLPAEAQASVKAHGRQQVLVQGDHLFRQGEPHDGIAIIEAGMIRSFYAAPSGREITPSYWLPGNFVGGPDVFVGGIHMWSAVAARASTVTWLPGAGLRELARDVPDLALGIIDALVFKARQD